MSAARSSASCRLTCVAWRPPAAGTPRASYGFSNSQRRCTPWCLALRRCRDVLSAGLSGVEGPAHKQTPLCSRRAAPAAGERGGAQAERAQAEAAQAEAELLERRLTGEQLERVLEVAEGIDVGYSLLSGQDSLWGEPSDI